MSLLPWTGTLVLVAPFAGKAVDLYGEAIVAVIGLLSQTFGYFMLGYLVANHAAYVMMIAPLAIAGMGLSMAGPALQHAVLGECHRQLSVRQPEFTTFFGYLEVRLARQLLWWCLQWVVGYPQ
ncbi:hypothetical protein MAA39_04275 [Lactiplantibacillus plantarum]|nr:hypothetical protein [Lactiplantibacillus plantarum]